MDKTSITYTKTVLLFVCRRGGLMFNNILSVIAAACLALSKYVNSFELIVVGRIFIGLFSGKYYLYGIYSFNMCLLCKYVLLLQCLVNVSVI